MQRIQAIHPTTRIEVKNPRKRTNLIYPVMSKEAKKPTTRIEPIIPFLIRETMIQLIQFTKQGPPSIHTT